MIDDITSNPRDGKVVQHKQPACVPSLACTLRIHNNTAEMKGANVLHAIRLRGSAHLARDIIVMPLTVQERHHSAERRMQSGQCVPQRHIRAHRRPVRIPICKRGMFPTQS